MKWFFRNPDKSLKYIGSDDVETLDPGHAIALSEYDQSLIEESRAITAQLESAMAVAIDPKPASYTPEHHLTTAATMVELLEAKEREFTTTLEIIENSYIEDRDRLTGQIHAVRQSLEFYRAAPEFLASPVFDDHQTATAKPARKKPANPSVN